MAAITIEVGDLLYSAEIAGEVPSKKNSKRLARARNGRQYLLPSAFHERWHKSSVLQVKAAGRPSVPIVGACFVELDFTHGDRIKRDHNNQAASVLDLLVDTGVIADDNWFVVDKEFYHGHYEKGNGGVKVRIFSLQNPEN